MGWQPGKSNRGHANWPVFSCNDETDYDTSRQVEGIEIDLFFLCKDEAVLHTRRRLAAVMLKRNHLTRTQGLQHQGSTCQKKEC
eukprot:989856-Pelagomonas_calceolata.AAC.8